MVATPDSVIRFFHSFCSTNPASGHLIRFACEGSTGLVQVELWCLSRSPSIWSVSSDRWAHPSNELTLAFYAVNYLPRHLVLNALHSRPITWFIVFLLLNINISHKIYFSNLVRTILTRPLPIFPMILTLMAFNNHLTPPCSYLTISSFHTVFGSDVIKSFGGVKYFLFMRAVFWSNFWHLHCCNYCSLTSDIPFAHRSQCQTVVVCFFMFHKTKLISTESLKKETSENSAVLCCVMHCTLGTAISTAFITLWLSVFSPLIQAFFMSSVACLVVFSTRTSCDQRSTSPDPTLVCSPGFSK